MIRTPLHRVYWWWQLNGPWFRQPVNWWPMLRRWFYRHVVPKPPHTPERHGLWMSRVALLAEEIRRPTRARETFNERRCDRCGTKSMVNPAIFKAEDVFECCAPLVPWSSFYDSVLRDDYWWAICLLGMDPDRRVLADGEMTSSLKFQLELACAKVGLTFGALLKRTE